MTPGARAARARPSERSLLEAVAAALAERGYRTYVDPDGGDYFDLAVRRGDEVGLVEGKLGDASAVLGQALRRRAWADWVAVALGSPRAASRLVARTSGRRAAVVGVWAVEGGIARELRPAVPAPPPPPDDPFAGPRRRFRQALDDLDRGALDPSVRWSGVPSAVRRSSAGRKFAEWRLDEPGSP
jgi:hypothetical protein